MIESNEPKDGDFVTYVEKLVKLPEGMRVTSEDPSPGEVGRDEPTGKRLLAMVKAAAEQRRAAEHERAVETGTQATSSSRLAELVGGGAKGWGRSAGSLFGNPARGPEHADDGTLGRPDAGQTARRGAGRAMVGGTRRGTATHAAQDVAGAAAKLIRGIAGVMIFIGLAVLAVSFAGGPGFDVEPAAGIGLIAMGAVFRRLAGRFA